MGIMMWSKKEVMEKDKNSIFVENFAGQLVEIFTGIMQRITESDANSNMMTQEIPLVVRGYIINVDDEFVYLGDDTSGISKACRIGPGMIIEIVKETSEFDDILDNMPTMRSN
jgi:hypothetical protein